MRGDHVGFRVSHTSSRRDELAKEPLADLVQGHC